MMRSVTFLLINFFTVCGFAQQNPNILKFDVSSRGQLLFITWTTSAGFSCQDLTIEHTTDTNLFESLYVYPGICGQSSFDVDYQYSTTEVFANGIHYFRINLGSYGYSETLQIPINNLPAFSSKVNPNPATDASIIFFNNDDHQLATIRLMGMNGKIIGKEFKTSDSEFAIYNFGNLSSGLYYYTIELNSIQIHHRFFLQ